ncbi:MAG TPA: helix-hairpin-helix domain-containing protein [Candidatus Acidoferrales bacterium]|nr:helix-hairpin-helix domain-containing protein [Candidatus Acidoferrales bacterium]
MSMTFSPSPCGTATPGCVLKFRQQHILFAVLLCIALLLVAPSGFAKKKAPDHPIDLNAATEKELEELPGVGPTTAKAIVEFREKSGKFKRVDDLLVIRGISEAKLARIRPYVVIGPPPAATKPNATPAQREPKPPPKKP